MTNYKRYNNINKVTRYFYDINVFTVNKKLKKKKQLNIKIAEIKNNISQQNNEFKTLKTDLLLLKNDLHEFKSNLTVSRDKADSFKNDLNASKKMSDTFENNLQILEDDLLQTRNKILAVKK